MNDDETTAVLQGVIDQGGEVATALTRLLIDYAEYRARAQALEALADVHDAQLAELERLRANAPHLASAVEAEAENARLRAVVDAALPILRQVTDTLRDSDGGPLDAWAVADVTAQIYRTLAGAVDDRVQLDVSANMGGQADG